MSSTLFISPFITNPLGPFFKMENKPHSLYFDQLSSTLLSSCRHQLFLHISLEASHIVRCVDDVVIRLDKFHFCCCMACGDGMGCVCHVTGVSERGQILTACQEKRHTVCDVEKRKATTPWTHFIPNLLRLIATETEFLILNVLRQRRPQHLTHWSCSRWTLKFCFSHFYAMSFTFKLKESEM